MTDDASGDRPRRYYLVERYVPSIDPSEVDAASARLHRTTQDGARHLATVLIPDEETCLSLFEAPGEASVAAANSRVGFEVDRIIEVRVFGVAADVSG
jgi:hypothetical protein